MDCLAVRKVGRHEFWGLARLQNERGEATSFDLLPMFLGEGHIPGLQSLPLWPSAD